MSCFLLTCLEMFVKTLCESLHKEIDDFPLYSGSFAENFVCNPGSELCMLGKCKKCVKCPSLLQKIRSTCNMVYQWEHVEQMVQAKKGKSMKRVKKIQKVLKEGTVDDFLENLEVQLPSFLEHVLVKRQQARIFKEKIEHLTEEEAVVQVDFAENFSCKYQGEVQSAPWSQDQVILFTVAIWTKSGDKNSCCESHVIVSDDLKHDKTSVAVFISKVVNDLVKGRHPNIT
ncbi:unnamed protein product [Porites lobata]|uniref:Uncharacterized protein n=1 Tax=Porites lobata TaxID=104759 RepID=A0ABN8RV86_9CNID|nr:unnamed protein product [Porites lobata]